MPIDDSYQRREILEEIRDLYLSRIADNKKRIVKIGRQVDLTSKGERAEKEPLLMANTVWRLRLAVVTDWLVELGR